VSTLGAAGDSKLNRGTARVVLQVCCALILLAGIMCAWRASVSVDPLRAESRVYVSAEFPGASPDNVETFLTAPLEAVIQGTAGVRRTESVSRDESTLIAVDVDSKWGEDLARLAVRERVEFLRNRLPSTVRRLRVSEAAIADGSYEAQFSIVASGPLTTESQQAVLEQSVRPLVAGIRGVARVTLRGGTSRVLSITFDPARVRALGLKMEQVAGAIRGTQEAPALGAVQYTGGRAPVVFGNDRATLDDIASAPIAVRGRVLRMRDFAAVKIVAGEARALLRLDGRPAVALDIALERGANAVSVAAEITEALDRVRPTIPSSLRIQVESQYEDLALSLTACLQRLALACMAAGFLLLVATGSWKVSLAVMAIGVVSISGTVCVLTLMGVRPSLSQLLVIGVGTTFVPGLTIHAAKVLRAHADNRLRVSTAWRMFCVLVVFCVCTVLPTFAVARLQAESALEVRVVLIALSVMFILTAAISVLFSVCGLTIVSQVRDRSVFRGALRAYLYALLVMSKRHVVATTILLVIAISSTAFLVYARRNLFFVNGLGKQPILTATVTLPRGSNPKQLDQAIDGLEALALGQPGVQSVRSSSRGRVAAQVQVRFARGRDNSSAPAEIEASMVERAVLMGGASVTVVGDGLSFSTGDGRRRITRFRMRLSGYSYDQLLELAQNLQQRLRQNGRVQEPRIYAGGNFGEERSRVIVVIPQRDRLSRFGLTARDFGESVGRSLASVTEVGRVVVDGEELQVAMTTVQAGRENIDGLRNAILSRGTTIPVSAGAISTIGERDAISAIVRVEQAYILELGYEFRGTPRLAQRTHDSFMRATTLPAGYSLEDLSQRGMDLMASHLAETVIVIFAGFALFLCLVATVLNSVTRALCTLLCVPFCLAGAVATLAACGLPLDLAAILGGGISAVVGVLLSLLALRDGVDVVASTNGTHAHRLIGDERFRIVRLERGRSITTAVAALTTLSALIPYVVWSDVTGVSFPMAVAATGGTCGVALCQLFVLPLFSGSGRA
jgi:multidrug efflux pump subunit AcrB